MGKIQLLKAVIIAQALCMIVFSIVVMVRMVRPDSALGEGGTDEDSRPIARVGKQIITAGNLQVELIKQHGESVLKQLMLREAVRLEAEALNLSVSQDEVRSALEQAMEGYDSERAFYDAMREQLGMNEEAVREDTEYRLLLEKVATAAIEVPEEDVEAYLAEHPEELGPSERVTLSWIVRSTKQEASDILQRWLEGESFETLASAYSIDEFTADNGGWIGTVEANDVYLEPGVRQALPSIGVGEAGGPVQVEQGWAVLLVHERTLIERPDRGLVEEEVRKQLALEAATPLAQLESELLEKYNGEVLK
ncbi:peptidyl-prolyl cis-trans isomerase [Paenibacillus tarimensis]|uniref:peptidyl-prolyl cis-trans isomerase n=1 Tax=Paenibacillus tarimensis TaxID=416012 RepID=UPI001F1A2F35|nr:peptidyl-prolyl cis-trans isomerase [Paenibacillus tarimensis]MCF2946188.1 peptidylprolyl isomerase [Paenibacillus tarimensis]